MLPPVQSCDSICKLKLSISDLLCMSQLPNLAEWTAMQYASGPNRRAIAAAEAVSCPTSADGVAAGTYVRVHVSGVSPAAAQSLLARQAAVLQVCHCQTGARDDMSFDVLGISPRPPDRHAAVLHVHLNQTRTQVVFDMTLWISDCHVLCFKPQCCRW